MKIYSVNDPEFAEFGKVLTGYDTSELIAAMNKFKIGAGRRPKKEWDPTVKICGECMNYMQVGMCGKKPEQCDTVKGANEGKED